MIHLMLYIEKTSSLPESFRSSFADRCDTVPLKLEFMRAALFV